MDDIAECTDVPGTLIDRFTKHQHYTFLGSKCLIALGYESESKDSTSKAWAQSAKEFDVPEIPHLFSMSCYAYLQMNKLEKDQSILLLGESGSGKSNSRKLLVKNLCDLGRVMGAKKKSKVHSRILKVDAILTGFGNAATPFNTNATCFIPYYELQYNADGVIVGMKIIDYLFDKSRVSGAEDGGRSFHIFHDLFDDLAQQDKADLALTDPAHFTYTADSLRVLGPANRSGVLTELTEDLSSLGVGKREMTATFKLLSTILHLGNVFFVNNSKTGEAAEVKNFQKLEYVADLLGVSADVLLSALTYKMKKIGKDLVVENLDQEGALRQRDSLARSLYAGLFRWIIEKINEKLCLPETEWVNFISILDIPGAEGISQGKNGLQRLLINYANERLLKMTLENMVEDWNSKCSNQVIHQHISRPVLNTHTVDLFDRPRDGILNILQSETTQGSNSLEFFRKLTIQNEGSNSFLDLATNSNFMFAVKHYVGIVEYDSSGFLESNSDVLQGNFVTLIRGSPEQAGTTNVFLRSIFSDRLISTVSSARDSSVVVSAKTLDRFPSMKRRKSQKSESVSAADTLAYQFKSNYNELLAAIQETNIWSIYHIRQNASLQSNRLDHAAVVRQTTYYNFNALKNYPSLKFTYEISIDNLAKKYGINHKDVEKGQIIVGKTSVFITQKMWLELEKKLGTIWKEEEDYPPSEHDSDTASHYGSEFDLPQMNSSSVAGNWDSSLAERKMKRVNNAPEVAEKRPITTVRRNWLCFIWTMTFCVPSFCLRLCRMPDKERQLAWREKVALCWIIFLMNASMLFLIIGTGWLICPQTPQLSPGQVSSFTKYDSSALVYMYGYYYAAYPIISGTTHQEQQDNQYFWGQKVLGRDASMMFPKDFGKNWDAYCKRPKPPTFTIFGDKAFDNDLYSHVRNNIQEILDKLPKKGAIVWDKDTLRENTKPENGNYRYIILYDKVYDVSGFFTGVYSTLKDGNGKRFNFLGSKVGDIFSDVLGENVESNIDVTAAFEKLKKTDREIFDTAMGCLNGLMYIGRVDHRNDLSCKIADYILLAASVILVSVIGFKFLAALQCYTIALPEESDKFAICQVPCYTEGETSLKAAIKTLATMKYDDKHKLLFLICDGMIVGAGNDRPTPRIVLDILGVDPNINPEPLAYKSLGEGNMQLNYAKVYSGLYESNGHTVPFIVVVKVGKPNERQKPGNRGKRDSQLILMQFLSRVHHNLPMSPLDLELYHQLKNVVGVDPSFYEFVLMVDADTQVSRDALSRLVSHMNRDKRVAGTCGETRISNERASFTTMIQIYEYFISHHLAKSFESLFSTVTCLPGCFSMYRIKSTTKNVPVLTSPALIKDYSENDVNTLHLRNLLHLGEDRYLTTLILKHFPNMKTTFTPDALCHTNAPDKWNVLLSQRRRWINSTIHNLLELINLRELCGFCCLSMRFVVFIDLFATIVQPASILYILYLIVYYAVGSRIGLQTQIPIISLILIGAVYGLQVVIFLFRKEWQHIGWMVFYIIASPLFAFYIPIYSFWHFDDFSWGNTRVIRGDNGKSIKASTVTEPFNPDSVPLKLWSENENAMIASEDWENKSIASSRPSSYISSRMSRDMTGKMPTSVMIGGSSYNRSISPEKTDIRRRSQDGSNSGVRKNIPSDDELMKEIRHILSTSDLMTITKKKVRQQLSEFYGVDLSSKKQFIHSTIDSVLKGEL